MAGGVGQDGTLIYAKKEYVEKASSKENMRLFIEKDDNLAYLKKFDGSVIPFPCSSGNSFNTKDIHVNIENPQVGNGSLLNPYKSVRNAVESIEDFVGKAYNILLQPGIYEDDEALVLPQNAIVNFIAQGGNMYNTILNFPIAWVPNEYLGQIMSIDGVGLNDVFTVDATAVEEGLLRIDNSSINLTVENNTGLNKLNILIFNSNINELLITGTLRTYNCTLFGEILMSASTYVSYNTKINSNTSKINLVGDSNLYTMGTMKFGNSPYVFGEPEDETPKWYTDNISNTTYTGDIRKLNFNQTAVRGNGTILDFSEYKYYGTVEAPITGNITSNMDKVAGNPLGIVQVILHKNAVPPTFGPQFVALTAGGLYDTEKVNYITCTFIDSNTIIYKIEN